MNIFVITFFANYEVYAKATIKYDLNCFLLLFLKFLSLFSYQITKFDPQQNQKILYKYFKVIFIFSLWEFLLFEVQLQFIHSILKD